VGGEGLLALRFTPSEDVTDTLQEASRLLSLLSHYAGVVVTPRFSSQRFKGNARSSRPEPDGEPEILAVEGVPRAAHDVGQLEGMRGVGDRRKAPPHR